MGYKHSREDILAAAVETVTEGGLASLTFRRVGERLGIPDRTVVYYFPTKSALLLATVEAAVATLEELVARALGDSRKPPGELLQQLWTALRGLEADAAFRVFLDVAGQAAAGRPPFTELAPALVRRWLDVLAERVDAPPAQRSAIAGALLAQLDGLMLIRLIGSPELADSAARGAWLAAGQPGGH